MFNKSKENIYLNLNEFNYTHCDDVINKKISIELITKYYDVKTTEKLKAQLANYNNITIDNILLLNGGDTAIEYISNSFNIKNAKIIFPTYGYYEEVLNTKKININKSYKNDIVFICNPNNPNGLLYSPNNIENELINNKETIYVIDETYMDYIQLLGNYAYTCTNLLKYPNLYIIKSFSKAFGLAGMRISYIISNKNNINNMNYNQKNILEISKLYAISIMNNLDHYKQQVINMNNDKKKLVDGLKKYNIQYIDTCANFVCIKVSDVNQFLIKSTPYIFRDISNRKNMENYIRVTICKDIYKIILQLRSFI